MGLTPVGSGTLMTPILIFGFCIKPHVAIDAELLSTVSTKLVGTVSLARHRLIDWRVLGQMAWAVCLHVWCRCMLLSSLPLRSLKNLGPDHPLPLVRLTGLRRTQIDCLLI